MAYQLGRRCLYFTDHALNRWWDRCKENEALGRKDSLDLLKERFEVATWSNCVPAWAHLTQWHTARAEGFVYIDDKSGFVVNRSASGDRVCVTYIERYAEKAA